MKKQNNKKKVAVIVLIIAALIAGIGTYAYTRHANNVPPEVVNGQKTISNYASNMKFSGEEIPYELKAGRCDGSYEEEEIKNAFITSVKEVEEYFEPYETIYKVGEDGFDTEEEFNVEKYFDEEFFKNHTLAIEAHDGTSSVDDYCLDSVTLKDGVVNINTNYTNYRYGGVLAPHVEFQFFVLDKDVKQVNFNFKTKEVNNEEHRNICDKPVIYLYPEEEQQVQVKLGYKENITCSYPKYENGWNVLASPDGTLVDQMNGKKLYSLYYECENKLDFQMEEDGFVVKGEDSAAFLEEKLEVLGLNYKEAEEFIIYWLPKLEANKYNYIRFATLEEIEENMPLSVSGNPDSVIRVIMEYKGLEQPIKVKEQNLTTPERTGFTVVEWGGMELK